MSNLQKRSLMDLVSGSPSPDTTDRSDDPGLLDWVADTFQTALSNGCSNNRVRRTEAATREVQARTDLQNAQIADKACRLEGEGRLYSLAADVERKKDEFALSRMRSVLTPEEHLAALNRRLAQVGVEVQIELAEAIKRALRTDRTGLVDLVSLGTKKQALPSSAIEPEPSAMEIHAAASKLFGELTGRPPADQDLELAKKEEKIEAQFGRNVAEAVIEQARAMLTGVTERPVIAP